MNQRAKITREMAKHIGIVLTIDRNIQRSLTMEQTRKMLLAGANELVRAANCFDAIRKLKGDEDGRLEKLANTEREVAEELRSMAMTNFVAERPAVESVGEKVAVPA